HLPAFSSPPFALLPFLPLSVLPWRQAVAGWLVASVVLLGAAFVLTVRAAALSPAATLTLAAIFLAWEPLENSMGLGQINTLVLALLALFVWSLVSGRVVPG